MKKFRDYSHLPGVVHWRIGQRIISVINDGYFQSNKQFVNGLSAYEIGALLRKAHRPEEPLITINTFLIQGDDHAPILIDTGYGKRGVGSLGHMIDGLEFAGVTPADIGAVFLTHLHGDHIGGLLNREEQRVFPNAKIYINKLEHDYWLGKSVNEAGQRTAELARKVLAPYKADIVLFEGGSKVLPGIVSVPMYGHTPGHTGFRIDDELLMWGGLVHLPVLQTREPMTSVLTDYNPTESALVRRQVLEDATANHWLVAGTHLEFPALGYVERFENGFRIVPELWVSRI